MARRPDPAGERFIIALLIAFMIIWALSFIAAAPAGADADAGCPKAETWYCWIRPEWQEPRCQLWNGRPIPAPGPDFGGYDETYP